MEIEFKGIEKYQLSVGRLLMLNPDVPRDRILESLGRNETEIAGNSTDVAIYRLRSELAEAGDTDIIEGIRGEGYQLKSCYC
jgi:DNA-binding response OmpR family regulator